MSYKDEQDDYAAEHGYPAGRGYSRSSASSILKAGPEAVWITKEAKHLKICEMGTRHLTNVYKTLVMSPTMYNYSKVEVAAYITVIGAELKTRGGVPTATSGSQTFTVAEVQAAGIEAVWKSSAGSIRLRDMDNRRLTNLKTFLETAVLDQRYVKHKARNAAMLVNVRELLHQRGL